MITIPAALPRLKRMFEHALSRCDHPLDIEVQVIYDRTVRFGADAADRGVIRVNDAAPNWRTLEGGAGNFIHEVAHKVAEGFTREQQDDIKALLGTTTEWNDQNVLWSDNPSEAFADLFVLAYTDIKRRSISNLPVTRENAAALRKMLTPHLAEYALPHPGPRYSIRQSYMVDGQPVSEPVYHAVSLDHLSDVLFCDNDVRDKLRPKKKHQIRLVVR